MKITTINSNKKYKRFLKHAYNRVDILFKIMIAILVVISVMFLILADYDSACAIALMGVFVYSIDKMLFWIAISKGNKFYDTMQKLKNADKFEYEFYVEGFEVDVHHKENVDELAIPYNVLVKIEETKEHFYLYLQPLVAFIVDKNEIEAQYLENIRDTFVDNKIKYKYFDK